MLCQASLRAVFTWLYASGILARNTPAQYGLAALGLVGFTDPRNDTVQLATLARVALVGSRAEVHASRCRKPDGRMFRTAVAASHPIDQIDDEELSWPSYGQTAWAAVRTHVRTC